MSPACHLHVNPGLSLQASAYACAMIALLLLAPVPVQEPSPAEELAPVEIAAWLDASELVPGESYAFGLEINLSEEADVGAGGLPELLLQIDPPASVRLEGPYLESYEELAKNEFLAKPYERLFEGTRVEAAFELVTAPAEGETIGLIVVGYLNPGGDAKPVFLRRLELPLVTEAWAEPGNDRDSSWGAESSLLQIGDRLPDIELTALNGLNLNVNAERADAPLFLTTYRAFW